MDEGNFGKAYRAGAHAYEQAFSRWTYWLSGFVALFVGGALSRRYALAWYYQTIVTAALWISLANLFAFGRRILLRLPASEK